jgi:hypothetical protein
VLNKPLCTVLCIAFLSLFSFSQTQIDSTSVGDLNDFKLDTEINKAREPINPLAPSKAAFYSAILPGLGQAYNKKYWKIPIVYAAIGTGVYFYITNTNELNRYRDAYKRRQAGFTDDEFFGQLSDDSLIRAQKQFRRNQELSILVTLGLYALNIIDANVDAHLLQYNVDENLAIKPHVKYNEMENTTDLGLTLNFKF